MDDIELGSGSFPPSRITALPILAALVLMLSVLYVGSDLALVTPPGKPGLLGRYDRYRLGEPLTPLVFFPLEQIDRKVRPEAWIVRTRKE